MKEFYKGKNVLVTGHTGFKGSWMCQTLLEMGANVTGYALEPPTEPSLFEITNIDKKINSVIGDIRDIEKLQNTVLETRPEIMIHMAAQPIVRESYRNPVYTYETNVMGTVNAMECLRHSDTIKSFVNVTTDKVYDNREWERGYREDDVLDGYDPYSNSKSCSELVTHSYKRSFFNEKDLAISTVRAGNVIGGGDFAVDRIVPDCIRAAISETDIVVRNPYSIRPYQHVLEPVTAYLMIAKKQFESSELQGSYNVGPDDRDCVTTETLVNIFCREWGDVNWVNKYDGGPHEAGFLKLDCNLIKRKMGWYPKWDVKKAIEEIVLWTKAYLDGNNVIEIMNRQIGNFINE